MSDQTLAVDLNRSGKAGIQLITIVQEKERSELMWMGGGGDLSLKGPTYCESEVDLVLERSSKLHSVTR